MVCAEMHFWGDWCMFRCIEMGGKFVFDLIVCGEKRRWLEGKGWLYGV